MGKRVGIIGTGIMGGGMARHLLATDHAVVVFNRTAERTAPLVALGAEAAASPAALAAKVDVIITAVRDDAALRTVILGVEGALGGARPGTTFIECSTVSPAVIQELGAAVEARGCHFLDAPVTGSKVAAESGKLGFLISGRQEVLESQHDLLNALGQSVSYFGPLGKSATFKLANNQLAAVLVRSMGESIAPCEAAGLDRATVVEALVTTATRVCGLKKEKLLKRDWSTDFALSLMLKDIDLVLSTAAQLNVAMPQLATAREIYRQAEARGAGDMDFAAVIET